MSGRPLGWQHTVPLRELTGCPLDRRTPLPCNPCSPRAGTGPAPRHPACGAAPTTPLSLRGGPLRRLRVTVLPTGRRHTRPPPRAPRARGSGRQSPTLGLLPARPAQRGPGRFLRRRLPRTKRTSDSAGQFPSATAARQGTPGRGHGSGLRRGLRGAKGGAAPGLPPARPQPRRDPQSP